MWMSPDPLRAGQHIYYTEVFKRYTDSNDEPIYFAGTDPRRDPGFPPPEDAAQVMAPREQWVSGLTNEQWYAYMGLE